MVDNSPEETNLLDEYIALAEKHGVNSQEAASFRKKHPGSEELFQGVDELETSGRRARLFNTIVRAAWMGAFIMVTALGFLGFHRGIKLADTQTLLAETLSQRDTAKADRDEVRSKYAGMELKYREAESAREKLAADLKSLVSIDVRQLVAEKEEMAKELKEVSRDFAETRDKLAMSERTAKETQGRLVQAREEMDNLRAAYEKTRRELELAIKATTQPADEPAVMRPFPHSISHISFGPDGQTVAAVSRDSTIGIWRFPDGKLIQREEPRKRGRVLCAGILPRGEAVAASLLSENSIGIWSLGLSEDMQTIKLQEEWGPVSSCAFSPDGGILAFGSANRKVWLVERASGKAMSAFEMGSSKD